MGFCELRCYLLWWRKFEAGILTWSKVLHIPAIRQEMWNWWLALSDSETTLLLKSTSDTRLWIWYGPPLCYVDAYMFTRKGHLSTAKVSCLFPLPQQLYLQTSPESNGKFILNLQCNEALLQFCGEVAKHLLSALFLGQETVAAHERYWCFGLVRCFTLALLLD